MNVAGIAMVDGSLRASAQAGQLIGLLNQQAASALQSQQLTNSLTAGRVGRRSSAGLEASSAELPRSNLKPAAATP